MITGFFTFFGMCLLGAFCVIGDIEWVKSVRNAVVAVKNGTGKKSTVVWPFLSLIFAGAAGFAMGNMPQSEIFNSSLNSSLFALQLVLAFNEVLGYNVIVKLVFHWVDKVCDTGRGDIVAGYDAARIVADSNTYCNKEQEAAHTVVDSGPVSIGEEKEPDIPVALSTGTAMPYNAAGVTGSLPGTVTGA